MIGASAINTLVGIAITSHLSSALGVEGFGKYNFILTYVSYFIFLTSLGTDVVAVRTIAMEKEKAKDVLGNLILLKLILSMIAFCIILIPAFFVNKISNYGWILVIFALPCLINPLNSVSTFFEATKKMEYFSFASVFMTIINYVLLYIFVKTPDNLFNAGLINLLTSLIVPLTLNLIFFVMHGEIRFNLNKNMLRNLLTKGLIIGFIQITIMMIHYFNISILGFMKGDREVGLFSSAYRAFWLPVSFLGIFHTLIIPILSENYVENFSKYKSAFKSYQKIIIFITFPLSIILIFFPEFYLKLFFNLDIYYESIICFQLLVVSLALISINASFAQGLLTSHSEKKLLFIVIVQLSLNILSNIILVQKYDIKGSAISLIIAEVIGLLFYYSFFRKIYKINTMEIIFKASVATIAMSLFIYFTKMHFIPCVMIGIIIYLLTLLLLKGYKKEELIEYKNHILHKTNNLNKN